MQSKRTNFKTRNKTAKPSWRPTQGQAIFLFAAALFNWLISTAYIAGQFEIHPAVVILNRQGCEHLIQNGITPVPQESTDTCHIQAPYRANMLDAGGRIYLAERTMHISELRLVSVKPLPDQPWTARHWRLLGWELICGLLVIGSIWLESFSRRWENSHGH